MSSRRSPSSSIASRRAIRTRRLMQRRCRDELLVRGAGGVGLGSRPRLSQNELSASCSGRLDGALILAHWSRSCSNCSFFVEQHVIWQHPSASYPQSGGGPSESGPGEVESTFRRVVAPYARLTPRDWPSVWGDLGHGTSANSGWGVDDGERWRTNTEQKKMADASCVLVAAPASGSGALAARGTRDGSGVEGTTGDGCRMRCYIDSHGRTSPSRV